jgi:peptide/nickel transport system permease protein
MIEVLETDYVKLARLLGVPEYSVIWKHALRNALIPVVGFGSAVLAAAVGGAVVVEKVFAWPGLGTIVVSSITQRDFPVLQGAILVLGLFVVTINLGADLLIGVLNPRGRS